MWNQSNVTSTDTFGTPLDGQDTTIWGIGAQDSVILGQFSVTGGLRYDGNSQFGDAVSPRGAIAWLSKDQRWKLRAGGGSGFRAPTVGELYFPFFGNPDLKPERSVSWEVGGEAYLGRGGRVEVTYFWNDLKDLIVYDFASSQTENIGSARTQGVEVGYRQQILSPLAVQASYTYLKAVDLTDDRPLIRRPRNQASLTLAVAAVDAALDRNARALRRKPAGQRSAHGRRHHGPVLFPTGPVRELGPGNRDPVFAHQQPDRRELR